ncbi:hypothetical protein JFL43_19325 [Viridibacillus sp. YIM B01967]|uniref:Uncharacterized protein n=1 Tax=Viridibacillus soli TaxID=2798301 RepID=A0ABS1HC00_9BACL|nr:hypothetical protein [Viridibacillus soli]MBK3496970.1 hypothetical protein [Viridibacillus soli]
MGTITLAEAVKLKSILTKKVQELLPELQRVAFVQVEKGEEPKPSKRLLTEVEADLEDIRKDIRLLDKLVYRANIDHTLPFKDEEYAIVEAIEYATQLRARAATCKEFAQAEQEEIQYGYSDGTTVYRVALFDPEEYRLKATELEKDAHKLSNLINAKNHTIEIDFDDSKYF